MSKRRLNVDYPLKKSKTDNDTALTVSDIPEKNKKSVYCLSSFVPDIPGAGSTENPYPTTNFLNDRSFSTKYYDILHQRIKLPVWEFRKTFFELLNKNQTLVLVGETGSGKTTQVITCCFILVSFFNL
ncbi:putative pre-mRNA-splicing factor ATP-dependent RNA helicase F56D2.6 [Thelohanellus kitauei]|uniref:RNA helicase n=1 Tax=Thelohanellus kitauei TaxID=669202 RepID=A0A0C2IH25_THEKT|nr:putative pre-mRNA-splicing factor ATP-dependent RNA helicase F56D2.6 [Thelohanellus kitauei]